MKHEVKLGAALTVAAITVMGINSERSIDGIPHAEAAEVCIDGSNRPTTILPEELVPLAALPKAEYGPTDEYKMVSIGRVSFQGSKLIVEAPTLPPEHTEAVKNAFTDPYVGCVAVKHTKGAELFVNKRPANLEMAEYAHRSDSVSLFFSESTDPQNRLFEKKGTVRATATHELTHAFVLDTVDRAYDLANPDTEGAKLWDDMADLYMADVKKMTEAFRQKHGAETVQVLQDLLPRLNGPADKVLKVDNGIRALIDAFEQPDGLSNITFSCFSASLRTPLCQANNILTMLHEKTFGPGLWPFKMSAVGLSDLSSLRNIDELYAAQGEERFVTSDEDDTLPELYKNRSVLSSPGHPFASLNEWVASTVASDNLNPDHVIQLLAQLPPERLEFELKMRGQLWKIVSHFEPELCRRMKTPDIVRHFR